MPIQINKYVSKKMWDDCTMLLLYTYLYFGGICCLHLSYCKNGGRGFLQSMPVWRHSVRQCFLIFLKEQTS
jgi:hypothetical protein